MKLLKNQMLQFSPIFMNPGTRNFSKIKCFNETSQKSNATIFSGFHDPGYTKFKFFHFLRFSWAQVQETSQKSYASIFLNFHDPGCTKLTKFKFFNFLRFSWARVHKTSQKSNALIFSNFHDPGYTKHHKNQMLQFFPNFMTPGTRNITKIKCFNFPQISWPRVCES